MTDVHCHILPNLDDGAEGMEDAIDMARIAAACGVGNIIATSHFRGQESELNQLPRFARRLEALKEALGREKIPVEIHPGAEILCLPETVELARQGKLPTLGRSRYVLCEFFFDAPYGYMDDILDGIARAGYRVVVAHPERYETIIRDPRGAERWFRRGHLIQMNKGSILGAFGGRVQAVSRWLLDGGLVHMIASDAHSPRKRTTDLSLLRSWLLERYPAAYAELLLEENPGRILRNQDMVPTESF